jgi:hypothetical protein
MAKAAPKPSEHPIVEASKVSQESSARLLKELSYCVPWEDYAAILGVEDFEHYKLVAMFDLWSGADHRSVLSTAGVSSKRAAEIRKTEAYSTIRSALEAAMLESTKQFTDAEWLERGRTAAWKRLYQDTAFGPDKERALAAARDFTDRTSPKATRAEAGGDRVLFIPEGLIELLGTTMKEAKQIEGEVVDVTRDED